MLARGGNGKSKRMSIDEVVDRADRGRVTLQVIAGKLDVSTATVSLALRDSPVVADATKARVQALARELGYIYNRSAASLRTARTNMIAVGFHDITNPYFAEMLVAVEETAAEAGRTILLGTYAESLERQERVLGTLKEYRPDGMILCPAGGATAESLNHLTAARIPVVQISREIDGVGLDFVGSDDEMGADLAIGHLVDLGHTRIAMIGGNDAISTGRARHRGYRAALERRGLRFDPALVYMDYGSRQTGLAGIQAVLDLPDPPTAAFCFNDLTAFGALLGLRHRMREAGVDFSIVGCDDVQEAAQWYPALTTVRNHHAEMGRRAAELLIERIENPDLPPRRVLIAPELIVRASTVKR